MPATSENHSESMNKHVKLMRQAVVICTRAGLVNIALSCKDAANEIERLEALLKKPALPRSSGVSGDGQTKAVSSLGERRT